MGKIVNFLKKHWLIVFLAFWATILLTGRIILGGKPAEEPERQPEPQVSSILGANPGQTQQEVVSQLGSPLDEKVVNGFVVFEYQSPYPPLPNEVYFAQKNVVLVKERLEPGEKKLSEFTGALGGPDAILYDQELGEVYPIHVFSQHGLAIAASPVTEDVFEIWYFSPTTLSQFLATWGRELSSQLPSQF